jgi:hypothetical protein
MYEILRPVSTRIFCCCAAVSVISKEELIITFYLVYYIGKSAYSHSNIFLLLLRRVVFNSDSLSAISIVHQRFCKPGIPILFNIH